VNAQIAVVENEAIERNLVTTYRHNMWDEAQERLLGCRSNRTDGIISILPPGHIPYVPDCCFDLGSEKSKAELACGSNGNRDRFGLLFKGTFAEPKGSEVERAENEQ
jgi:hypothetical protein